MRRWEERIFRAISMKFTERYCLALLTNRIATVWRSALRIPTIHIPILCYQSRQWVKWLGLEDTP